jgi:serine/threonine-protein kinase
MTNSNSSPDLTNKTIAGFTILHRLGVGGMSEVYLAFQQSLHRHVALKVMRSDYVGSADHEQRFLQEARAVASLMHPNIVQVYDVGKFDSIHYIAQEYVPGSNLHAYIQRRGALPLEESVSILWQATAALQKAASIGLVHRDIKPDNLLLTPDGEVKIADFGLARSRGQSQNLTAVGVTLGTPLYMSPEQIQGLAVDSRTDLYSLGATAYHMLSGRPPFSGETNLALAMQHVQADPVPLKQLRPDLPDSLVDIVHKLLNKSPDERFATAAELSRALRAVIDEHLGGTIDKMVPFTGLVIEHQRLSNLAVTQTLQQLAVQSKAATRDGATGKWYSKAWKPAAVVLAAIFAFAVANGFFKRDLFHSQATIAGVKRQSTIQKQYAMALLENDLMHWQAVSEYFPPKDAVSWNYFLKSQLQIARKQLEGENYTKAVESVRKVLEANYQGTDIVLLTIARIEMGWLAKRTAMSTSSETFFQAAERDLSTLGDQQDKRKLILDSLPNRVRLEWDEWERELLKKSQESRDS